MIVRGGDDLTDDLVGAAGKVFEVARTRFDVGARHAQRLAGIQRLDRSQRILALAYQLGDAVQDLHALLGLERPPAAIAIGRTAHGPVDIGSAAAGKLGIGLAARRIDHGAIVRIGSRGPLPADDMGEARQRVGRCPAG